MSVQPWTGLDGGAAMSGGTPASVAQAREIVADFRKHTRHIPERDYYEEQDYAVLVVAIARALDAQKVKCPQHHSLANYCTRCVEDNVHAREIEVREAAEAEVRALREALDISWKIIRWHPECDDCEKARDTADNSDAMCQGHLDEYNALWGRDATLRAGRQP